MKRSIFFDRLLYKKIFFGNDSLVGLNNKVEKMITFSKNKKFLNYTKDLSKFLHKKNSLITDHLVGQRIYVHMGKEFFSLKITLNMVGYKLGEFFYKRKELNREKKGIKKVKK